MPYTNGSRNADCTVVVFYPNLVGRFSYWPLPLKCQCHVSIQPIKVRFSVGNCLCEQT